MPLSTALFDDDLDDLDELAPERIPEPPLTTPVAIRAARAKLQPVLRQPESVWPLIGAAFLCAGSALALAAAVIMGPPNVGPDVTVPVAEASAR